MKKFLPIVIVTLLFGLFFLKPHVSFAQLTPAPGQQLEQGQTAPDGSWVIDPEVTFIGKNAARSGNLLDFTLQNYNWVCVKQAAVGQCDDSKNPLRDVWSTTFWYIVIPLLFFVILVASIVIIVTRGRSLSVMRFLPRFIAVLLLIVFSFSILQFLYQITDATQGFFLGNPDYNATKPIVLDQSDPNFNAPYINQRNLVFLGWKYQTFQGLSMRGDANTESRFITLLLTKLTALTYFAMVGILYIRRIILWLFIIVSPVFPILLLFYPVRNTGKIWIGEFFRWLLYAPLFAVFLKGLVSLWRSGIPLIFTNFSHKDPSLIVYPTAVNILLGGPKEFVTPTNSVNLTETFALYVVSLLMLWGVMILPWILLQIFLDYAQNMGFSESPAYKKMVNMVSNRQGPPPIGPDHPPASGGSAISLPFTKKFNLPIAPPAPTGMAREIPAGVTQGTFSKSVYMPTAQVKAQVLSLTNMSLPSMRDIAKYDTSLISRDKDRQKEVTVIKENLEKIANPTSISSSTEREKYVEIREKLTQESKSGNTLATSIISAANTVSKRTAQSNNAQLKNILTQIANPSSATSSSTSSSSTSSLSSASSSVVNRAKLENMNKSLVEAKKSGNTLAASILSVTDKTPPADLEKLSEKIRDARMKGEPIATQITDMAKTESVATLPAANRVQTVSKEDYEAVKSMWEDNYRNLEVPEGMSGTRGEWVKDDMTKIENIISLLDSKDEEKIKQGMDEVSSILPFLLVGGFSQTEIVSYLKAKLDAAKSVAAEIVQDDEEKVEVTVKKTAHSTQTLAATLPEESGTDEDDSSDLSDLKNVSKSTVSTNASNEILTMSNLKLPKLTDIVQYEVRHLTKDKTESERIEKIHDVLERIGNPEGLKDAPERTQYESLREKLSVESQKGNATADVILSAVSQLAQATGELGATLEEVKMVLTQIANPSTVSTTDDKDYYTRLHEYLEKESKEKGNSLAQKILSVNTTTKAIEIQEIRQQMMTAQQGGDLVIPQIANAVSDFAKVNKLRTVINQLTSSASQESNQVFNTINQTLRSESAKGNTLATSILSVNEKTSDTALIQVYKTIKESSQKGDAAATAILQQVPGAPGLASTKTEDIKTVLTQIANPSSISSVEDKNYYTKIHDLVEKESKENNNTVAQKILSVTSATSTADIQQIKGQLISAVTPANSQVAQAVTDFTQVRQLREVIRQSLFVAPNAQPVNLEKITKLRGVVTDASTKGNKLAASLLAVNNATSDLTLKKLNADLVEAGKKGDLVATSVLSQTATTPEFATTNRMQEVTPEEYEEAKKLWEKAYKQYFVPQGYTEDVKGRTEWINNDIKDISETINLLESPDEANKEKGTKKVSSILPFLLLGGFSFKEMITYLKTKLDAASSALKSIQEEEDNSVVIEAKKGELPEELKLKEDLPDESKQE